MHIFYIACRVTNIMVSIDDDYRDRVNKGLPRERGARRSLQEEKVGYLLVESDRRETTAILDDIRLMSG